MEGKFVTPTRWSQRIAVKGQYSSALEGSDRTVARSMALLAMMILAVTASVSAIHAPTDLSREFLAFSVTLGLAPIGVQVLYKLFNRRKSNWLCVELVAMGFYCVVHFAFIIYWLNGDNPYDLVMWESVRAGNGAGRVCFTIGMCAAGIAMFGVGFHLLPDRFETASRMQPTEIPVLNRWRVIGFRTCLATAVTSGIILGLQGPGALEGGYKGTETESGAVNILIRMNVVLTVAAAGCMAVASFRRSGRIFGMGLVPTLLLLGIVTGYAIHGDRGLPFSCVFVMAVAYSEQVRRISLWQCAVFVLVGMLAGTLVGVARVSPNRTFSSMYNTIMVNSEKIRMDHAIVELGYSVNPMFASTTWVPEKHPIYYGRLMSLELANIVPFGTRLPLVQRLLAVKENYETSSSKLLTWLIVGNFDSGGKGTTSAADFYLNFGMPGVLIGLFAEGLLAKYLQQKSRHSADVLWCALYAFVVPALGYGARGTTVSVLVETMVWPGLFLLGFRALMHGGVSRRRTVVGRSTRRHSGGRGELRVPLP